MSETWYRISGWDVMVEAVEVLKYTEHFVTFKDKRFQRNCETRCKRDDFFKTFAEARQALIDRYTRRVESAKNSLQSARSSLGQAQSLKEPQLSLDQAFCDETEAKVRA